MMYVLENFVREQKVRLNFEVVLAQALFGQIVNNLQLPPCKLVDSFDSALLSLILVFLIRCR